MKQTKEQSGIKKKQTAALPLNSPELSADRYFLQWIYRPILFHPKMAQ